MRIEKNQVQPGSTLTAKELLQYRHRFSALDWSSQGNNTSVLLIPQKTYGLSGPILRVCVGMQTANGAIRYDTYGIYRTKISFLPKTADILLTYPDVQGYWGAVVISTIPL